MWKTGEEEMPPYGETIMYKLAKGKTVREGICFLDKTDGNGHHFQIIAEMSVSGNRQPHISMVDDGNFLISEEESKLFVWYDMVELNKAGLMQAELIRQKGEELKQSV